VIKLKQAESTKEFDWILKDPEIFERIAEDGISSDDLKIPFDGKQCYQVVLVDDKPIGVWCFYPVNSSTLNIHANILMQYRKEHAKDAAKLALNWFATHSPDQYVKLNAEIPVIYDNVYHYTKKAGFSDEGTNRMSIMKAGKLVDQYRLGLTRSEALELYGDNF